MRHRPASVELQRMLAPPGQQQKRQRLAKLCPSAAHARGSRLRTLARFKLLRLAFLFPCIFLLSALPCCFIFPALNKQLPADNWHVL